MMAIPPAQVLATLTRPDGTTAVLHHWLRWHSDDRAWAEVLNARFDPTLDRRGPVGGMPAYVHTVAAAAEQYGCRAKYPWSGSRPRPDVVH